MPATKTIIRQLLSVADDLSPTHVENILYTLESGESPTLRVQGPLYVNATEGAELMGFARSKFYEIVAYRHIPAYEFTPGFKVYFTQDLLVHNKCKAVGGEVVPEAAARSVLVPTEEAPGHVPNSHAHPCAA